MKETLKKHLACTLTLAVVGMAAPSGTRAGSTFQNNIPVEQGELTHAIVFLGILVALVGISRLVKKSS